MNEFDAPQKPGMSSTPKTSGKAIASLICGLLSFIFACFTGLPAILLGLAALRDISTQPNRFRGKGVAIGGILTGVATTLLLVAAVGLVAWAMQRVNGSVNNMKQIGLALHNYHDTFNSLPPAGVEYPRPDFSQQQPAEEAQPQKPRMMLSWRVRLLPYLEEYELYQKFDFNQPWDSPHNKALIPEMPDIYRSPMRMSSDYKTIYLGVVYPREAFTFDKRPSAEMMPFWKGTLFDDVDNGGRRYPGFSCTRFAEVRDGTSNTIAVVEANSDQAVIWTKPDDWEFNVSNPRRGLGDNHMGGFLALLLDGRVQVIPAQADDHTLRCLFGRTDGQAVQQRLFRDD